MRLGLLFLGAGGLGAGCAVGPGYLFQAGLGQWKLFNRARPLEEVLKDERTSARTWALLREIAPIKAFGESAGLSATRNYTDYVEWDGPAVVWVVTACEPLAFRERFWSFPIVGGFNYLGWFEREKALQFADELQREQLDTDVRGAAAYSTLGWFRDPVVSTMVASRAAPSSPRTEPDTALAELVNLILHESVHATLHLPSEPVFNESLASFVADELTPQYLAQRPGSESQEIATAYLAQRQRGAVLRQRLQTAYEDLRRIYESAQPPGQKLSAKKDRLAQLRKETGDFRDWNNASLVQFKTYETGEAEYRRLFESCRRDLRRFLSALRKGLLPGGATRPSGVGGTDSTLGRLARLAQAGCAR